MEFVPLLQWSRILVAALYVLVRGADLFVEGAKQIGAALVMSSFAIGVLIVGIGTSLPELASSIATIAIGTSLPELFVSLQALKAGDTELAIGNIFGSNAFNILMVVGIPGLLMPLYAGEVVMELGLAVLIAASLILFVLGLARQVQRWEGVAMLIFFCFFLIKLVAFV